MAGEHEPGAAYDLFVFKPKSALVVKVRLTRSRINPDTMYEDLLPDDLRGVRALPFPAWLPREIRLRTQHERAWRRLRVHASCGWRDRVVGA